MSGQRPLFDPNRMAAGKSPARPAGQPSAATQAAPGPQPITVSALSALIKRVLGDHLPGTIHLVAQISNCTRHSSGHLYLTLKDDKSEIKAVMWRSAASNVKFQLADGMEVVATGYVDLYESRGQYQFYINRLEPRGVGSLELAFRQLREKLQKEGLFETARKRPVPKYPRCVAVVTSPTGAAIRDILRALARRCRCVSVLFYPVRVQGEGAAQEIAAAIRCINSNCGHLGGIDTLIVGRGGGSLEDLWAFNEEIVARAIVESRIPVISGVGHEVDVTIADLVADLRAATPTAAAEHAVPVLDDLLSNLASQSDRLRRTLRHRLQLAEARVHRAESSEWFRDPAGSLHRREQRVDEVQSRLRLSLVHALQAARQKLHELEVRYTGAHPRLWGRQRARIDQLDHRLQWAISQRLRNLERRVDTSQQRLAARSPDRDIAAITERLGQWQHHLERALDGMLKTARQETAGWNARLESTSHHATLARGFSITRDRRGQIITQAGQVKPGDRVTTETSEGAFDSRVSDARQGELFE